GGFLPAMLQRVEHKVDLPRCFGVGVDGGYAALLVWGGGVVPARDRRMRGGKRLLDARYALIETLGHAVTVSTLRVDWRELDHAELNSLVDALMSTPPSTDISTLPRLVWPIRRVRIPASLAR